MIKSNQFVRTYEDQNRRTTEKDIQKLNRPSATASNQEKIHPAVRKLLSKRGIESPEDIREFLSPKPKKTYDPFLLKDMKEGVELIGETAENGGKICIYGDYDADGVTSTAIMMTVIRQLTDNVYYHIPSRFKEGYGLNKDAVRKIAEDGTDLLVTVDCGSVSYEEVELAKELGMKVLVTDHHSIDETRADCLMINPKQSDCSYPFEFLAGCGVAYKVAQAVQRSMGLDHSLLARLLDLVAIGTIGDVVPLVDENRTLVKYGLREINSGKRLSLRLFEEVIPLEPGKIDSESVSFGIVPRINAAGRMDSADIGVKMFLSEDKNDIRLKALIMQGYNSKRREIQDKTFDMCMELAEEQCGGSLFPVILAESAHEGITGIVAGKLRERLKKPVIIVTPTGDGMLKGTGRCIESLDLYEIMKQHQDLFIKFGGHKGACGFTMDEKNLEKLRKGLNEDLAAMDPEDLKVKTSYDLKISAEDVTNEMIEDLSVMEPFGSGNPRPVFLLEDMKIDSIRYMGSRNQHARLVLRDRRGTFVTAVLFSRAEEYEDLLSQGDSVNVTGKLSINEFNGTRNPQMEITDISRADQKDRGVETW